MLSLFELSPQFHAFAFDLILKNGKRECVEGFKSFSAVIQGQLLIKLILIYSGHCLPIFFHLTGFIFELKLVNSDCFFYQIETDLD